MAFKVPSNLSRAVLLWELRCSFRELSTFSYKQDLSEGCSMLPRRKGMVMQMAEQVPVQLTTLISLHVNVWLPSIYTVCKDVCCSYLEMRANALVIKR